MNIRREFTVHMLNEAGKQKARQIAETLTEALDKLEQVCGIDGREMALVRTKFEELSFFAKKRWLCAPRIRSPREDRTARNSNHRRGQSIAVRVTR